MVAVAKSKLSTVEGKSLVADISEAIKTLTKAGVGFAERKRGEAKTKEQRELGDKISKLRKKLKTAKGKKANGNVQVGKRKRTGPRFE